MTETHDEGPAGQEPPDRSPPDEEDGSDGPSALVMLVVAALLVVGGYFLANKLADMSRLQDCAMSGRTNCAPIQTSPER